MSALTKATAKKKRKKPANRSVISTGRVVRHQSNVSKSGSKKKARVGRTKVAKSGKKLAARSAGSRKKATTSSRRKPKSPQRSARGFTRRIRSIPSRAVAVRKARKQKSRDARPRIDAPGKSRRRLVHPKPIGRPKSTRGSSTSSAKRGRPLVSEKLKSRRLSTKLRERKEKDRLKKQLAKERARQLKLREQEKHRKQRDAELSKRQRQQEQARKQREQLALRANRAKEAQQRAKEEEKRKKQQDRDSKRQAEIRAREEERRRSQLLRDESKRAKEDERLRLKAEREAEREQARKQKEEERTKREAEREAYRKAKEAERERLRATKEAQKRALEGRISEATRNANKLGGGRSTTTRFYSPRAIPNQSGTTRRALDGSNSLHNSALANGQQPSETQAQGHEVGSLLSGSWSASDETPRVQAPPERPLPTAESVEERFRIIEERLKEAPVDFRHGYQEALDMSWIYHDLCVGRCCLHLPRIESRY